MLNNIASRIIIKTNTKNFHFFSCSKAYNKLSLQSKQEKVYIYNRLLPSFLPIICLYTCYGHIGFRHPLKCVGQQLPLILIYSLQYLYAY